MIGRTTDIDLTDMDLEVEEALEILKSTAAECRSFASAPAGQTVEVTLQQDKSRKVAKAIDLLLSGKIGPPEAGMYQDGRTKLAEECGELITVIEKINAFGSMGDHWDGKGLLKTRLEDEMADLDAAMTFVAETHDLDLDAIHARSAVKLQRFWYWHRGGELADPTPEEATRL